MHREDMLDLVVQQGVDVEEEPLKPSPEKPAEQTLAVDFSELDQVVQALSNNDLPPPPAPNSNNNHLSLKSNAVTPSIPSYPSSSVSTQPSSPRIESPSANDYGHVIGTYVALYAYEATNDDEVDLVPGDVVKVVETCDDGWYVGTCQRTGVFGTFPGNYVSLTNS